MTLMVDPCPLPSIEAMAGAAFIRDDGSEKKWEGRKESRREP